MTVRTTLGISLKMYLGHQRTMQWAHGVADVARTHPALADGTAELFVLPSFPEIIPVTEALPAPLCG